MKSAARIVVVGLIWAAVAATSLAQAAAQYGSAAEALALLKQAVAAITADKAAAIVAFNDPKGGYRDRDLYVFCANLSDGVLIAHPQLVGTDLRTIKDKDGKPFGSEMMSAAHEGQIVEVAYMWPRPGSTDPVAKSSYVTAVGDQMCGVGYYK